MHRGRFVAGYASFLLAVSTAAVLVSAIPAHAAPGDLDPTFDGDGKVNTPIGVCGNNANAVAVQTDGKIVVAGYSNVTNCSDTDFAVARYNPDGSLDPSFGTGGKVTTPIGTSWDIATAMAIQGDGKIVVVGYTNNGSNNDFGVVRYNSDGSLDTSFGTGGKVTTSFGTSTDDPYGVAIQTDGKIVVAGWAVINPGDQDFALARYTTDGSLDSTFGTGGKVSTNFGSAYDDGYAVAVQSDGKIVVAGVTGLPNYDVAVARYTGNGSLDATFGSGGLVTTGIGSNLDVGNSIALQGDGNILVGGWTSNAGNGDFLMVRYTPTGGLDGNFGTGGIAQTPIGAGSDVAAAMVLQPDGRIVQAGSSNNGSDDDVAVARFTSNGSLDPSFGTGGTVTTSFGSGGDYANGVAVQTDGKVVTAGYTTSVSGWILTRYKGDPTISINDVSVTEGNSGVTNATFTVSLSDDAHTTVTVQYYTSDGTAKSPSDYTSSLGTVTLPAGSTSGTVTVAVNGDTDPELDENFSVKLYSPSGATLLDGIGVGTILNDDSGPTVTISPSYGPPTTRISISGTGFGANEAVDIYFDQRDVALAATDGTGSFTGVKIRVPKVAQPGDHPVTGIGRITGLAGQGVFTVRTDWPTLGFNAGRSGANTFENTINASKVKRLDESWSSNVTLSTGFVVAGGVVYVSTYEQVSALDADTGALIWSYPLSGEQWIQSPTVSGGVVYVSTSTGRVYAFDAATGARLWATWVGFLPSPVAVYGGSVYVGQGSVLWALATSNGALSPVYDTQAGTIFSTPTVTNGIAYVPSSDGTLYAVRLADKVLVWSASTGDSVATPCVVGGVAYVSSYDGNVYALNASNGSPIWTGVHYQSGGGQAKPTVGGGKVYVGGTGSDLIALSASTGATLWDVSVAGYSSDAAVANGVVYLTAGTEFYALNPADGSTLWSWVHGGPNGGSPVVADGTAYMLSDDGNLHAFRVPGVRKPQRRPDPGWLRDHARPGA